MVSNTFTRNGPQVRPSNAEFPEWIERFLRPSRGKTGKIKAGQEALT